MKRRILSVERRATAVVLAAAISFLCLPRVTAQDTAITALWANNGEDKVTQDELRASNGGNVTNRLWDGSSINQFGARNEVVEFNLILEAKIRAATGVSVTMSHLSGPGGSMIRYAPRPTNNLFDWTSTDAELFYIRYLQVLGASHFDYGTVPATWQEPSFPTRMKCPSGVAAGCAWTQRPIANKFVPDIAVPIELVPTFTINAGNSQAIWGDIYIPKTAVDGLYSGTISVSENGIVTHTVPLSLRVRNFTLPDIPSSKTMVATAHADISPRYTGVRWPNPGTPQDVFTKQVLHNQLFVAHRHKISLIDDNMGTSWNTDAPAPEWIPMLTGVGFTAAYGYRGPGEGVGNNVFSIGTYGGMTYGSTQAAFTSRFNNWESWFVANAPSTARFVYLCDEIYCDTRTPTLSTQLSWWQGISGIGKNLHTLATQPLVSVVSTSLSDPTSGWPFSKNTTPQAAQSNADAVLAAAPTRRLFGYATTRPGQGSVALEDDGTAMRELPWGEFKKSVERWFVWEGTYYEDDQHNRSAGNLFTTAETFGWATTYDSRYGMIDAGHSSNGEGLLFYPGTDAVYPAYSYGINGPIVSLRFKIWRRGIQDVDYLALAKTIDPTAVATLVQQTVPRVLWEVPCDDPSAPANCTYTSSPVSWSSNPDDWESARSQLADIIEPSNGSTAPTRIEQNDPAIVTGPTQWSWTTGSDSRASGGSYMASAGGNAMLRLPFTGTGISVIGVADSCSGQANLDIDGVSHVIDAYRAAGAWQQTLFSTTGLVYGSHTLTLTVLGTKQAASCGAWVYIDAFDLVGTSPPQAESTRIEQSSTDIVTGPTQWSWNTGSDGRASGGSYMASAGGNAMLRLPFTGTGISVIGVADSCSGQAEVEIDGVSQTIDAYRASGGWQQTLFSTTGLISGSHTLTLTVLGTKQAASCGSWVYIDAFDIRQSP